MRPEPSSRAPTSNWASRAWYARRGGAALPRRRPSGAGGAGPARHPLRDDRLQSRLDARALRQVPREARRRRPRLRRPRAAHRIVPGLIGPGLTAAPDVMRGGDPGLRLDRRGSGPRPRPPRVCLPGTRAKWAVVEEGAIVRFVTAMTGELWAVLLGHSACRRPSYVPRTMEHSTPGWRRRPMAGRSPHACSAHDREVVGGGAAAEAQPPTCRAC